MRTKIKHILHCKHPESLLNKPIQVSGWIRTLRDQKSFSFIELNDGSCLANLQVIADASMPSYKPAEWSTGASLEVHGVLVPSPGKNQALELKATSIRLLGACSSERFPLQKKRHSFEFLRTIAHLRPRTNTQGAVLRVRNALSFATHLFFQERGFIYVQTPLITGSDCEGGGEMFRVTTLDPSDQKKTSSDDFFGKPTYLTVSGQLEGEVLALALSDVYTFGPTFRAENSNTSRHLAEFWMIEPEMAFADLKANMECAENYLQFCVRYILEHCKEDLQFFDQFIEKGLLSRLEAVAVAPFARLTYTEAVQILKKAPKTFEFPVEWGIDLQSEHERYLAEEYCKKPVILTDYPAAIKSFYMRANEDGKTVAAMDILVPKIGEIIGGSQREERWDVLDRKIADFGLKRVDYWWYLELREFGSVPHAGFGAGLERLVLFATGMENIRDVIPFPRFPGHAEF
jgi:asparaginyl-tRNA synthetase